MSKRVVNKIVAFTLIIATVVFFQGTGNSYADIPKTTTPNPTISNAVVKTNEQVTNKQTKNKTNVKVNVKKISIDTVTRKSGTISVSWKKNKKASGYRIQYSNDKYFKNVKNKNVKSASKTKTKIAKVNKSKNYYVRVSAYVKKNNKKYYFARGEKMYYLTEENSFDSAHFLAGYDGKCSNLHGHRWKIILEVQAEELKDDIQHKGMYVDFGELKKDLRDLADSMDHALIIEKNSLKETTLEALKSENFRIIELDFRPTAENMAKYFYEKIKKLGYNMKAVTVYETPVNSATYME